MSGRKYGERNYPENVNPQAVDDNHNSHGIKSPYTADERRQAAALTRRLEDAGLSHNEAIDVAFDAVGLPDKLIKKVEANDPQMAERLRQIDEEGQAAANDVIANRTNQQRNMGTNNGGRRSA